MIEPFCWITAGTLRAIREGVDAADRKAARLLLLALTEMAMEAYDGKHTGFAATTREVMDRAEVSENTYKKARRCLEDAGALRVEHPSRRETRWILEAPGGATVDPLRGQPLPPAARACETAEKKEELESPDGASLAESTRLVFEHWQRVVPGRRTARLTPERRKKIQTRLQSFTVDELIRVLDIVSRDPFLNGDNDRGKAFNDFEVIFRNDTKVADVLEQADSPPVRRNGRSRAGDAIDALQALKGMQL